MPWNDGYFDKYGNQILANDFEKEVYNGDGNKIGYFSNGIIRGNNGNILVKAVNETKPSSSNYNRFLEFLGWFGIDYFK